MTIKQKIKNNMPSSLASTPPMGWNSWNTFGHNINETAVHKYVKR